MKNKIIVFDTTLRDGEQSPGASMTLKEKIAIANLLDNMKVDVIEAGFAAASDGDIECIKACSKVVKKATICSLARANKKDISKAAKSLEFAKKPRIHTFMSTSPIHIEHQFKISYEQVLETIHESVSYARSLCDDVEWSAMDATRSDMNFLSQAVQIAVEAGAKTINIPDTVGYILPIEYSKIIATLHQKFPDIVLSVHCHNDLGLATSNSLAGVLAGARQVECTINGIGERAGNAAMEEIVMAMNTRQDIFNCNTEIDTRKIYPISRFVSAITGFPIQKNKAIVGSNAFAHESGIHQDGILKNRETYEIMSPEEIGIIKNSLIMGKHSGRAAVKSKIKEWGMILNDKEVDVVFKNFKKLCDCKKHATEDDLLAIIRNQQTNITTSPALAKLHSFEIKQQDIGHYNATVTIIMLEETCTLNGDGDGPLDAIFKSVNSLFKGKVPKLRSFETHSISEGTDAQAEAYITLNYNNQNYIGHARDTDTIVAATLAYLGAINKAFINGEQLC